MEASHLYIDILTDRQVLTLYCEFDLGGEGFGSHPVWKPHTCTDIQTDRYLHCTVILTWMVRGLGVTLLEASHLYTYRQTDRYLHCTVSLTWVVRGLGVTLFGSLTPVLTYRQTGTYTVL